MVSSKAYPDLERKPGGPDNWVEAAGGLPKYIERIAKHLHYERGFTISHAIATAVNTVKRWARKGGVVKYNDPENHTVTTITAAQAAKAVAEWEAKKRRGSGAGRSRARISLSSGQSGASVDLSVLVERANRIENPAMRGEARRKIYDLSVSAAKRNASAKAGHTITGTTSFPIDNEQDLKNAIQAFGRAKDKAAAKRHIIARARTLGLTHLIPDQWKMDLAHAADQVLDLALTKDGRKSYKNRGRWRHGFIPVDEEAKVAKAKGSPIAMKRMRRLFGGKNDVKPAKLGRQIGVKAKEGTGTERVGRVAQARHLEARDATRTQKVQPQQLEISRGRRPDKRSTLRWGDIKDEDKVTRGGKRYVLTTYGGRQSLTEWTGPEDQIDVDAPDQRDKRMREVSIADVRDMTTAQLRRMLALPGLPQHVRERLNQELTRKEKLGLVGGKRR